MATRSKLPAYAMLALTCWCCLSATAVAEMDVSVLEEHQVQYSLPRLNTKYSSEAAFNARGMQHVYTITHVFLDIIQRKDMLPPSLNKSVLLELPAEQLPSEILQKHWPDILLQYVGVATIAICGILMAIIIPIAGFCVCCCRCAGKCGVYPRHFDKRGDPAKRLGLGIVLAVFVIAAMFGVVTSFVTNQYVHDGLQQLPVRMTTSTEDTSQYLDNTVRQVNSLLVANYAELQDVLNRILDDSGPILKRTLAQVTQAVAIDNLASIVSGLGNIKRHLRDIQNNTLLLQGKVQQLRIGLDGARARLLQALKQCSEVSSCLNFLQEYDLDRDLTLVSSLESLPLQLPDVSLLMRDISDLINNDIERKVRGGQKQLDKVKVDIENSISDIRPKIKEEIKRLGQQLGDFAADIEGKLSEVDMQVGAVRRDVPKLQPLLSEYGNYLYYIGLGMSCLVLLILLCYVFGLFYGFCGKRPGNTYGDDCCNTGTGANWLVAAVYLTFIFSLVLMLLTTAQFLVGSTFNRVVCDSLRYPNQSDVFEIIDAKFVQPYLRQYQQQQLPQLHSSAEHNAMTLRQMIDGCHRNLSIYQMLHFDRVYDVRQLRNWRQDFNLDGFIQNLKSKIQLDDLKGIQILSPQAEADLQELAESQISDFNFTQYTRLLEQQITAIDLNAFTSRLRQVRSRLGRDHALIVGPTLDNEALFLDQMGQVVVDMKLAIRQLQDNVAGLEKEARFNKLSLRDALRKLLSQASRATQFLRNEGPQLIDSLADKYVNETLGLIDSYVERVINQTENFVGRCEPVSRSYNATVMAMCNGIVDPFNGFWTSIGWCYMFFLPSIVLALSLVSLYRQSEAYPGPLVEPHPADDPARAAAVLAKKKKKRGHRRNPSEYLPDSAHYRAGYAYQERESRFQDLAQSSGSGSQAAAHSRITATTAASAEAPPAGGPPRYTSNPNLVVASEYERPPPYYLAGSSGTDTGRP